MSDERSQEQKAKDLRDALRAVDNKTLDGIPWYLAEALAAEISRLRAALGEREKALEVARPIVCNAMCESTWPSTRQRLHSIECVRVTQAALSAPGGVE